MDTLVKGMINGEAAVYACDITQMANEMQRTHNTLPVATMALGRTLAGATLMCSMLKHKNDRLTLQINGGGVTGTLMAVGGADLVMKACIGNPKANVKPKGEGDLNVGGAVGTDGFATVIKDLGLKAPYVGKTRMVSGEIGEDLAQYFMQSEQQPSIVYLNTWVEQDFSVIDAGGVIIKPLPKASEQTLALIESKIPMIRNYAIYLMSKSVDEVLKMIFPEIELTEHSAPRYQCDCSRERLIGMLVSLGKDELNDMIERDGGAQVTCRFCNKEYNFSKQELQKIVEGLK